MNIGIFTDCYLPTKNGVVTCIVQAREALAKRGHNTFVFTVDMPGYRDQEGAVYRLPSVPFYSRLEIRVGVPRPHAVHEIARQARLDVIHTHSEASLGLVGKWTAHTLGLPLVHTTHSVYGEFRHYLPGGEMLSARTIQWFLSSFLSSYDALVCPSLKSQQFFRSFMPDITSVVIGNGVSRDRFHPGICTQEEKRQMREQLGIGPSDRVILHVGRLAREKRVLEILDALAPLLQRHAHFRTLFVGTGPDHGRVVAAAQHLGVAHQVILAGTVPWERMPRIYALADVLATASLSEIHPMTVIEAAMCGLPVVARYDLSYVDLVEDGHNGYLVQTDPEIAGRVEALLEDDDRLRQFASNALALSSRLDVETHAAKLESLYRQVIDARAG